jgi:cytochrome P450
MNGETHSGSRYAVTATRTPLADDVLAYLGGRADIMANPYPLLARLREEAPVYRVEALDIVLVSSYEAVSYVLRHPKVFPSDTKQGRYAQAALARAEGEEKVRLKALQDWWWGWFVEMDGAKHRRIRNLAQQFFTQQSIELLRGRIQSLIDELLEPAVERGSLELVTELALPVPEIVICDLLAIPRADSHRVAAWSRELEQFIGGEVFDLSGSYRALQEFRDYLLDIVHTQRQSPTTPLMESLVMSGGSDRLDDEELWVTMTFLLFAGHETTTNLIGNGVVALMRNREEWQRLVRDPQLAENAVEEILRYDPSVHKAMRVAASDVELGGLSIEKGETVRTLLGAACRDPQANADPDTFDITREQIRHVGFGIGSHFCLGSQLARLETQLVLTTLAQRFSDLQLAGDVTWRPAPFLHGPEAVPLDLGVPERSNRLDVTTLV